MKKNTAKVSNKTLIFNAVSLLIAAGLFSYGVVSANHAATGYGIAIALMPLVTKSIKAGVSVKRVFAGIAIYALGISLFAVAHIANIMQIEVIELVKYAGLLGMGLVPVGLWVGFGVQVWTAPAKEGRCGSSFLIENTMADPTYRSLHGDDYYMKMINEI